MSLTWISLAPGVWRAGYTTPTGIPASSYAFTLADGSLAVMSPPCGLDDAGYAAVDALGKLTAIVAPNSGHDLGQAAWQQRYPDATPYGPAPAIAAIQKAKKGLRVFRPLEELASRLPAGSRIVDVPGTRSGSAMVSVGQGAQRMLYVDEVLGNLPTLVGPAPFKLAFWLTGSGPGLSRNRVWTSIFAKDKRAVARTLLDEMSARPPTAITFAHGEPLTDVAAAERLLRPIA
jgi:hypothetical protein